MQQAKAELLFFIVCIETKQTLFSGLIQDGAVQLSLPPAPVTWSAWASSARQHLSFIQVWSLHSLVWGGRGVTFYSKLNIPSPYPERDKNYAHRKNGIIIKIAQLIFVELAVWKLTLCPEFIYFKIWEKMPQSCIWQDNFYFCKSAFAGLKEFLRKTNTTCDTIVQQIVYLVGAFTVNLRLIWR